MSGELVGLNLSAPSVEEASDAFGALGFDVSPEGILQTGEVQIVFEVAEVGPYGLLSWTFLGETDERLRLDTKTAPPTFLVSERPAPVPSAHPNGVTGLDHVVLTVPALETAVAGLEEHVSASLRRRGEVRGLQAAFVRAGSSVIEVIGMPALETPHIWGVAFTVDDIAKTLESIREHGGAVSDAQPALQGGTIASSPAEAAFGINIAYLQPNT